MRDQLIHIRRLAVGIGLLTAAPSFAQVATTYTFDQSVGTYTPITGGTVIASDALFNLDEEVFSVPVPTFYFDGVPYSSLYVSTNGFITFGGYEPLYDYEPVSSFEPYDGVVAAFGTDVDGADTGTGEIRYEQVGDELVIQWQDVSRYDIPDELISFQIRLNSVTGEIAVVYGPNTPGDDIYYPQVGLRGPDPTFATNVNNREVLSGPWSTSTAGTDEFSTLLFDSADPTAVPENGLTFVWTPVADLAATRVIVSGTEGCYGQETVALEVKNIGGSDYDFAATPLTVDVAAAGPNAMAFPQVVVNTGTLAAGAVLTIPVSAGYDMTANGTYTFNASFTGDVRVSNNAVTGAFENSRPTADYPDVVSCDGADVTLSGTVVAPSYPVSTTNTTALPIPDNDAAGVTSSMVVSNAGSATASEAVVTITSLTHTYVADLTITLIAPDGSSIILALEPGSGEADMIGTVFSSDATQSLSDGDNPFTGTYLPDEDFSLLTGAANGTWQLHIADNYNADAGTLNEWSIAFPAPNSIVSYAWMPASELDDAAAAAPVASPTANTLYTVTVTDELGCTGSDDVQLTMGASPVVTASSDAAANTICEGTEVTLNGSGADTYTWTGSVVDGEAFAPAATDTYTVTGTAANGCEGTADITITVDPAPAVSHPDDATCDNSGTLALDGGMPVGGTYSGTGVSGSDFDPAAGTQTLTYEYTDANGCSNTADFVVTVNPLPAVTQTPFTAVCEDAADVTLTGGSPAGGTYSGTGVTGDSFDPSAGTQTIMYTYTDANGCVGEAMETLTVNPLPNTALALGVTEMCVYHNAAALTGGSPAGGTYSGAGVSGGSFDPATAGSGTHTVTYEFTDANGCSASATDDIVVDECLGLEEGALAALVAFPNPGKGAYTIRLTDGQQLTNIFVTDAQGKVVSAGIAQQEDGVTLDLTMAQDGIYFMQGQLDGRTVSIRLIKQ